MISGENFYLDFIRILGCVFVAALCLVVGSALYKQWKRNRLTNPRRDYYPVDRDRM